MSRFCHSLYRPAQSIAEESQQQTRSTAQQVAELQEQLAGIAAKHNARTEELYVKFAAVLNEKKRKAEELKHSLDTMQATLQVVAACTNSVFSLATSSFRSLCRQSRDRVHGDAAPSSVLSSDLSMPNNARRSGRSHGIAAEPLQADDGDETDHDEAATTASGSLGDAMDHNLSGDDAAGVAP